MRQRNSERMQCEGGIVSASTHFLSEGLQDELPITLKNGMVLVVAWDNGPGGHCGQSVFATRPHMEIHVFDSYEDLEQWGERNKFGRGGRVSVRGVVIGSFSIPGEIILSLHGKENGGVK